MGASLNFNTHLCICVYTYTRGVDEPDRIFLPSEGMSAISNRKRGPFYIRAASSNDDDATSDERRKKVERKEKYGENFKKEF